MGAPRNNHQAGGDELNARVKVLQTMRRSRPMDGLFAAHELVDQADRTISTGQLHASLRFHIQPINVVVFHGSQGNLVLRAASRLDAFSGYPFRT